MSSSPRPRRPEAMIRAALREHSMARFQEALNLARSADLSKFPAVLRDALRTAASRGFVGAVEYLLDIEKVPVSSLHPSDLSQEGTSVALLDALHSRGWDPNQSPSAFDKGSMLLDRLCDKEDVVKWLVDHGAPVTRGQFDPDYAIVPKPAPILETCAALGSLSSFKLLHTRGAPVSRRTLHKAAATAASHGADPAPSSHEPDESPGRRERAEILRYLVDDLKLDINQMDRDIPVECHEGTPINYAAARPRGAKVVKWLLSKGADPTIKGLDSQQDAQGIAMRNGCEQVFQVLEDWKQQAEGS